MNSKITYSPLFKTLDEKGVFPTDVGRALGISSATMAKFKKGETVTLKTIIQICDFLDVPIEKVVQMAKHYNSGE